MTAMVRILGLTAGLAISRAAMAAPFFEAANMMGPLWRVDLATNAGLASGNATFATDSLAGTTPGVFFAADALGSVHQVGAGPAALIGNTGFVQIAELDADPSLAGLWGFSNAGDVLFYFDLTLRAVTIQHQIAGLANPISGLAAGPGSTFYLSDWQNQLLRVTAPPGSPPVLSAATIGTMATTDGRIADIDFEPVTGQLIAATWSDREVLEVSTVTAATQQLHPQVTNPLDGGLDINAITFTAVPEPASAMVVAAGLALLARRRRP